MTSKKKCFVIAPIGDHGSPIRYRSDNVLEYIIKPATKNKNYEVQRADELSAPGVITEQIMERIKNDDLVIADLTGGNPNVFYELAIRHAVGKPAILIIEEDEHSPFDVANMRTIRFNHKDLKSAHDAIKDIIEAIKETEKPRYRVVSPLSTPLGSLDDLRREPGSEDTNELLTQLIHVVRDQGKLVERYPHWPQ